MRILCLPSDTSGCGHYRLVLPSKVLSDIEAGVDVQITRGISGHVNGHGDLVSLAPEFLDFDVVVYQRPMLSAQLDAIRLFQDSGIAVVVEVDDDFAALHKQNSAFRHTTAIHRASLMKATQMADLVTCTTDALARRYGAHGRVAVLPNYVPASWLDIQADRFGDVIGWSGTVATHPNDLQSTAGGVGNAVEATDCRFRVIGRSELVQQLLRLPRPPELIEWTPIDLYPHELARLDVGIAPLANTVFNRAKSWLKPLELATVGVPLVMADVGEYRALADWGIGLLASNAHEWHGQLVALIANPEFREEQSALGREAVRERFLIEQNAWRWPEAWETALHHRHKVHSNKEVSV